MSLADRRLPGVYLSIFSCLALAGETIGRFYSMPPYNFTIDRNQDVGAEVARINATDESGGGLSFFLLRASVTLPGGITEQTTDGLWVVLAKDATVADCSASVLMQYPAIRNQFCINHTSGVIHATRQFYDYYPPSGTEYVLQGRVVSSAGYVLDPPPLLTIKIASVCDNSTSFYLSQLEVRSDCKKGDMLKLSGPLVSFWSSYARAFTFRLDLEKQSLGTQSLTEAWLVAFEITTASAYFPDILWKGVTSVTLVGSFGDSVTVQVSFLRQNITRVSITTPLRVRANGLLLATLGESANFDYLLNNELGITLIFLRNDQDFCSQIEATSCAALINDYWLRLNKTQMKCPNVDKYHYMAKYGFCGGSARPNVTRPDVAGRTLIALNIDTDYDLKLISKNNYATGSSRLEYKLLEVQGSQGIDTRSYAQNSLGLPEACGVDPVPSIRPRSFFCIDANTGDIYTTYDSRGQLEPGNEYKLTVQVRDVFRYPPRIAVANLQVVVESKCQDVHTLYRALEENNACDKFILTASGSFMDYDSKVVSEMKFGVAYKVQVLQVPDKEGLFIAGLKVPWMYATSKVLVFTLSGELGESGGTLGSSSNDNVYLDSPFRLSRNHTLTFRVAVSNGSLQSGVNVSQVAFILLPSDAYCNAESSCLQQWAEFFKAYKAKEAECRNLDAYFFQTKYGLCLGLEPISVHNQSFVYTRGRNVSNLLVIPSFVKDSRRLSYQYDLLLVRSSSSSDQGSLLIPVGDRPIRCESMFSDIPRAYFCVNPVADEVYLTGPQIATKLEVGRTFQIHVRVTDESAWPVRQTTARLDLNIQDDCFPSSSTYANLRELCPLPIGKLLPKIDNSGQPVFIIPNAFQEALSLSIYFDFLSSYNRSASLLVKIRRYNGETFLEDTSQILEPSALSSLTQIDVPVNLKFRRQELSLVQLVQLYPKVQNVTLTNFQGVSMNFLYSFQCSQVCLRLYQNWTAQIQQQQNVGCSKDPFHLAPNFEACSKIKPQFVSKLKVTPNSSLNLSSPFSLGGCSYTYTTPMEGYLLKDGFLRINFERPTRKRRTVSEEYPNLDQYIMGHISNSGHDISRQGYYQCVVFDESTNEMTVQKDGLFVKFQDVFDVRLEMRLLEERWSDDLSDPTSSNFTQLAEKLREEVLKLMQQVYQKNITKETTDREGPVEHRTSQVEVIKFKPGSVVAVVKALNQVSGDAEKLQQCQALEAMSRINVVGSVRIASLTTELMDCCKTDTIDAGESFLGVYTSPVSTVGQVIYQSCKYGTASGDKSTVLKRQCVQNDTSQPPKWTELDLSVCKPKTETSALLLDLNRQEFNETRAKDVARELSRIVSSNEGITTVNDVDLTAQIISKVLDRVTADREVGDHIINVVNELLHADLTLVVQSDLKYKSSKTILSKLDKLGRDLDPPATDSLAISKDRIALGVRNNIADEDVLIFSTDFQNQTAVKFFTDDVAEYTKDYPAAIYFPKSVLSKAGMNAKLYSYTFKVGSLFTDEVAAANEMTVVSRPDATRALPNGTATQPTSNGSHLVTRYLQSRILSATIVDRTSSEGIVDLSKPIKLSFRTERIAGKIGASMCAFWNSSQVSTSGLTGVWSTTGCRMVGSTKDMTYCECDHLTNFAILLDTSQTGANPLALQIVSWIGCGISLGGLLLTVVTYLSFSQLRKNLPPKILICLCLSLMAVLIIFLAGVERTDNRLGCQIVAGLLHYFLLATFCWMAVEGVNLYRCFVKVFASGSSETKFLIKASIFGWGAPLVIVVVTGALKPTYLGPETVEDAQFCVLRGNPFYFALLLPIAIVLLGNIVVLVLVLKGIQNRSRLMKDSKSQVREKLAQARIAFACAILLGITWLFAIVAVGDAREVFQWLFCIFNSLQGFFIFVFYCARNRDVRREWSSLCGLQTDYGSHSLGNSGKKSYNGSSLPKTATTSSKSRSDDELTDDSRF